MSDLPAMVHVFPESGLGVAAAGADRAVEEGFDDPRLPADGAPAIAVAPPAIVLDVEDRACWNDADPERIVAPAASLRRNIA